MESRYESNATKVSPGLIAPLVDSKMLRMEPSNARLHMIRRFRERSLILTLKYFGRLITYVGTIYVLLQSFVTKDSDEVHQTLVATRKVILLSGLMTILCLMMALRPRWYERVRWYCTPGNIFLRAWTPLFAVVYLIQLPFDLEGRVSSINILSWLAQIVIGYILAVASCGWMLTGILKFIKVMMKAEKNVPEDDDEMDVASDIIKGTANDTSSSGDDLIEEGQRSGSVNIMHSPSLDDDEFLIAESEALEGRTGAGRLLSCTDDLPLNLVYSYRFPSSLTISESSRIISEKKSEKYEVLHRVSISQSVSRSSSVNSNNMSPIFTHELQSSIVGSTQDTTKTTKNVEDGVVNRIPTSSKFQQNKIVSGGPVLSSGPPLSVPQSSYSPPVSVSFAKSPIQNFLSVHTAAQIPEPVPLIPTMRELFYFWMFIFFLVPTINMFMPKKTQRAVVFYQTAASIFVFIFWQQFRTYVIRPLPTFLQIPLQEPFLFMGVTIPIVLLSSIGGLSNTNEAFAQYRVGLQLRDGYLEWGAGDICSFLLNAAIVSSAFPAADSVMAFKKLMPILVPSTFVLCVVVLMETAAIASAFNTPMMIALPLLTRCIAAPIAINVAMMTGACPGIVAATIVINTILARISMPALLDFLRIKNPLARGPAASTCGLLLGIIALDENKEILAAGVGTAVFGLSTIFYTVLLTMPSFLKLLELISLRKT